MYSSFIFAASGASQRLSEENLGHVTGRLEQFRNDSSGLSLQEFRMVGVKFSSSYAKFSGGEHRKRSDFAKEDSGH